MDYKSASGATLILGGARSGKSNFAEKLVLETGLKPVYIATARALDEEMSERIAIHQERRSQIWETVEEPLALADTIDQVNFKGRIILVDCLSLWVSNLMMANVDVEQECDLLIKSLERLQVPIVFVSNEVGLGGIAGNAMARQFQDLAGSVNQKFAQACATVYFIAAGLPLTLKS